MPDSANIDTDAYLAAIVASSDDAIVGKTLDGIVTSWNRGAEQLFGYSAEEMIGQSILRLIPPEHHHEEERILSSIRRGKRLEHFETIRRRKDGALIDVSLTVSPVIDAQGAIIGASKIARDITVQKRRLRRQQQLYDFANVVNRAQALPQLFAHAIDAMIRSLHADRASILLSDDDGVMRFKAWRGLSDGYRKAVEGHTPWKQNDPAPQPIIVGNVAEWDVDLRLKHTIRTEGIAALAFIPLTYGDCVLGEFMVYFDRPYAMDREEVDLAQALAQTLALGINRTAAELRLKESEKQLRLALEAGRMGSWEWNISTNTVTWSSSLEAIHGLRPGAFEGSFEAFRRDIHPEDRDRVLRSIQDTLAHNEHHQIEYRIIRPDGQVRWVEGRGTLFRDHTGAPTRMIGVCSDITARKDSEARLRSFSDRLEQLVGERTEELLQSRDRLRAMATELNLAEQRERKRLATELHDHLQQLLVLGKIKLSQGKRLAQPVPACADVIAATDQLLTDALQYTRGLVAELSPPVLREHGLAAGLQWLGEFMRKHDMAVAVTVPAEPLTLPENQAVLLFQSVRELLMNCWKHAGTGQASVTVDRQADTLRIEVRDQGKGFDPGAAMTADEQSSKFGLLSIRERMQALGGCLALESEPGRGTVATISLQLSSASTPTKTTAIGPPAAAPNVQTARSPSGSGIRVLLVDDHVMVRQGLRTILDGYPDIVLVGEAGNGEEAVSLVRQHQPAVVVMDINMPRLDGANATAHIKAQFPHVSVIGLSVNADAGTRDALRKAGAALLLTKEAAADELYRAIHHVMEAESRPLYGATPEHSAAWH